MHVQGDCVANNSDPDPESSWPPLSSYAQAQQDRMRLISHWGAYMHPSTGVNENDSTKGYSRGVPRERSYPIVAVNYHRIWDDVPTLLTSLGLPRQAGDSFPVRAEAPLQRRKANASDGEGTSKGARSHAHARRIVRRERDIRADLRKMYSQVSTEIRQNPAVMVV